jgi:ATP-dependent Clp protease ATP-binding subunit ClpA
MIERFTDRAREVVALAQEEARMLNHNYIGTEHLLLGLIREGEGVAAKALESLEVSLEMIRQQVEEIVGLGQAAPTGHIPFTARTKKVLELSLREALPLGNTYIGTEHLLLGLIREREGVAAQVLQKLGADLDRVRQQVIQLLSEYTGGKESAPSRAASRPVSTEPIESPGEEEGEGVGPRCPTCRAWVGQGGQATSTVIEVPDATGGEPRSVVFVFCGRCGRMLVTSVPGIPGTQ